MSAENAWSLSSLISLKKATTHPSWTTSSQTSKCLTGKYRTSAKGNCERRRPRSPPVAPVVTACGDWRHLSLGMHRAGTVAVSMRSTSSCWMKKTVPSRPLPREPFTLSSGTIRSGIRWEPVCEEGGSKSKGKSGLTNPCFPDNPRVPELRPWSKIHPLHPRRQGHAVLGGLVRNPSYWQLRRGLSSGGHVDPWDWIGPAGTHGSLGLLLSIFCLLPIIANLH